VVLRSRALIIGISKFLFRCAGPRTARGETVSDPVLMKSQKTVLAIDKKRLAIRRDMA